MWTEFLGRVYNVLQSSNYKEAFVHTKSTVLTVLLTLSIGAFAADYYVAPNGTGDYSYGNPGPTPWGAAEKATQAGDVIHLAAGTYSYTTGNITVKPGVTMIGATENPEDTVIERVKQAGDTNNRCIHLGRNAVLRNLTVRGGERRRGLLLAQVRVAVRRRGPQPALDAGGDRHSRSRPHLQACKSVRSAADGRYRCV